MLYDIRLTITYEYDLPVAGGRQLLRICPRDLPGAQTVHQLELEITPDPAERRSIVDFFGNSATHVSFREAHDRFVLSVRARVERLAEPPILDISPPISGLQEEILACHSLDPDSPHHFLGESPRIRQTSEMTAYALEKTAGSTTAMEAIRALCTALHADLSYDPEATTVETPPEEAFERRHGVCQDFAQIMIACLRGIGIPAAYVSGFLRTVPPKGQARLEGADAMHAWVRAWCGMEAGWIEFDPTNALLVGADHIVIARGRDYGDVSPVAGVLRTAGSQETEQAVDVIALEEVPRG